MRADVTVVDAYLPTELDDTNLRDDLWSFALDQRAFGVRKLWVAFADDDGTFRGLAYTDRREPLELRFDACLAYLGAGATVAVAFCDEPVQDGPSTPELDQRLLAMRGIAAEYGIWLADWICCDDDRFRSISGSALPEARAAD
jgi:hypothetical protein